VLDLAKAAIYHLAPGRGMNLDVRSDAPPGSGLGGSSALTAAVIGAVATFASQHLDRYEFAELNYYVERQDLKIAGGKQDQFATTFGGFNVIEFHRDRVVVNPLRIDPGTINDLEAHLILCYTGRARTDLGLISKQIQFYQERRQGTEEGMHRLHQLVFEMKEALLRRRLDTFGDLLHEAYLNKKRMNPDITQGTIADELYERARQCGAVGGKLMGAGGGGYLLIYCPSKRRQAVVDALTEAGGQVTDFNFDLAGLQTWRSHCA
jgi:D-glycero-alpha-D-manno-heptose-7-phosphate kinase